MSSFTLTMPTLLHICMSQLFRKSAQTDDGILGGILEWQPMIKAFPTSLAIYHMYFTFTDHD